MSKRGLKAAAIYGIKPHLLGFCGPREKSSTRAVLKYLKGKKISSKKIRKILKRFEGAYAYYKLIARCNKIKDPFAENVVKAYWIGNNFLEKVSTRALKEMIINEFSKPDLLSKNMVIKKAKEIPPGLKPHHSFHVLVIGSVTGRVKLQGKLLDLCRIGWGKVIELDPLKDRVKVRYLPLIIRKGYRLGKPRKKYINWNKIALPSLRVGQYISFHWNQLAEILSEADHRSLKRYTLRTLKLIKK